MGVCVICLTRTGKISKKSFHKFPFKKNPAVAEKWVRWVCAVKKCSWTPCKTSVICSDHFAASAFDKSAFRVELNTNSVPTILLPNNTVAVSEVQTSKQKSDHSDEIRTESPLKKPSGKNDTISKSSTPSSILDSTALQETFSTPAKSLPAQAITRSDVTPKTFAPIAAGECRTRRQLALFSHDHNYENTPGIMKKKNIQLKENLNKVRTINKAQRQKIKRLKKRVESLKELLSSLGKDSNVGS